MIMELYKKNIRILDILTPKAFANALTVDMALGCSTNTVLHLAAIAHEAGIDFNLEMINSISSRVPNLCHLAPAGPHHMQDLNAAGGVQAVMNELDKKGFLDTSLLTVTGRTVAENIKNKKVLNHEVVRKIETPYSPTGGLAILFGSLAPKGAVVKRSAVAPDMLVHKGPARVFDCEQDATDAIFEKKIKPGDVVVIRYEGPAGGPGIARDALPDFRYCGYGTGQRSGAADRRTLLGRDPRRCHRTCFSRGAKRRQHCIC